MTHVGSVGFNGAYDWQLVVLYKQDDKEKHVSLTTMKETCEPDQYEQGSVLFCLFLLLTRRLHQLKTTIVATTINHVRLRRRRPAIIVLLAEANRDAGCCLDAF